MFGATSEIRGSRRATAEDRMHSLRGRLLEQAARRPVAAVASFGFLLRTALETVALAPVVAASGRPIGQFVVPPPPEVSAYLRRSAGGGKEQHFEFASSCLLRTQHLSSGLRMLMRTKNGAA